MTEASVETNTVTYHDIEWLIYKPNTLLAVERWKQERNKNSIQRLMGTGVPATQLAQELRDLGFDAAADDVDDIVVEYSRW